MLWGEKPYYSLDYYLKQTFGSKTYKASLDAGFTCPNRDGTIGRGGCIFCSRGQNYLKSLFALAFQAFLIMVCVGIYSVLVQGIATDGDLSGAIWACMGYTVLLCFALFKTGSLSKSLFGAH